MTSELFDQIATALVRHVTMGAGVEPRLRAAVAQIVKHPGKLLRAELVYKAAVGHGLGVDAAKRLACAVEYFHTASIVLDDLPCMDDATQRRGRPCIHRQHGDATAILASLTLINRAYALIGEAFADQSRRVRVDAMECLERCLGVAGLVGGQAWDLAFVETDRSARTVSRIAAAKTGALFALAILLPASLARPRPWERRALRALCVYWGQLFQIADDVRDVMSSSFEAGKTTGQDRLLARPNLALALGLPRARARMARLVVQADRTLAELAARGGNRWDYLREASVTLAQALVIRDEAQYAAA